jgi:hypothetical protein
MRIPRINVSKVEMGCSSEGDAGSDATGGGLALESPPVM